MAGLLGWLLYTRGAWNEQSDRSDIREWLDNTRIFRKTLAELVKEYVDLLQDADPSGDHAKRLKAKREELEEHVRAMTEPTRVYSAQLPLFPEVYLLEVDFTRRSPRRINWPSRSGGNRPSQSRLAAARGQLRTLTFEPPLGRSDASAVVRVEYRLHTYNRMQHEQDEYRFWQTVAAAVLLPTTLFAMFLVVRFLQRERRARWTVGKAR